MSEESPGTGTLDLLLPDWGSRDTVRRHPLPFALWIIGDQCLLYHWFDHAVNRGHDRVRVHVIDRPAEVRRAVEAAELWPVKLEVVTLRDESAAPAGAERVTGLPGDPGTETAEGWDLMDLLARLEARWLEDLQKDPAGELLSIGSACKIHPDALLRPPYFIGDNVFIGPGCEIGPDAVIGEGSMLAGANVVARSNVAPHTFLGPVTALEDCLLDGGALFNRRHRARIDRLEAHLSSKLKPERKEAPPTWKERLLAWRLARKLGPVPDTGERLKLHDGRILPGGPAEDVQTRIRWLLEVAKGRMRLFGVLPRSRDELDKLDPEWRSALEHAPAGVFSYADCHGCHSTAHPDEALHAVYQATLDEEVLRPILRDFVAKLSPAGFIA